MTEAEPRYSPPEAAAIVTRAYTQAETVGFVLDHCNGIVAAIRSADTSTLRLISTAKAELRKRGEKL